MEIKENTSEVYRKIYMREAPLLLRFAEKFVSPFYAEDIIHDVFLRFWDKQLFCLPENEVKRLLFIAVKNACIDQIRKLTQEQGYIDQRSLQLKLEELAFHESSDELFMQKDLLKLLMQKIEELPERSQEVFRMAYFEGLKAAEIAQKLDISVRTVENLLYRSLTQLRKKTADLFLLLIPFL